MINMQSNGPETITILPTYRCTAACKECCFESHPGIKKRLTYKEIISVIQEGKESFPDLKLIVFSGGECFTLKEDLYNAIAFASSQGFMSRCVSNGYWAKDINKAKVIAQRIAGCGLSEINFSTGLEHQKYVDEQAIINATIACCEAGIRTLIMVEKDSAESDCRIRLNDNPDIQRLLHLGCLTINSNTWMPFQKDYDDRGVQLDMNDLAKGCGQVFENLTITPHGRISSCCGLTYEHIPEMKIGSIDNPGGLQKAWDKQLQDFLKIWIKVDGPYTIIQKLMGEDYIENNIGTLSHNCQACVYLHKKTEIRTSLKQNYHRFVNDILLRYQSTQFVSKVTEQKNYYIS